MKGTPTCLLCIYFLVGRKLVNMEEIWKDIKGYEGLYQVSSLGRVRSLDRKILYSNGKRCFHKGKILNLHSNHRGYLYIGLHKNNIIKKYYIHRLVAEMFIFNLYDYPCINHKDENQKNNTVENLEWCSYKYNNNYGNHGKRISSSKSKRICQMSEEHKIIRYFNSITQAGNTLDIPHSSISACCKGKMRMAGGYIWKYAEEDCCAKSGS